MRSWLFSAIDVKFPQSPSELADSHFGWQVAADAFGDAMGTGAKLQQSAKN